MSFQLDFLFLGHNWDSQNRMGSDYAEPWDGNVVARLVCSTVVGVQKSLAATIQLARPRKGLRKGPRKGPLIAISVLSLLKFCIDFNSLRLLSLHRHFPLLNPNPIFLENCDACCCKKSCLLRAIFMSSSPLARGCTGEFFFLRSFFDHVRAMPRWVPVLPS